MQQGCNVSGEAGDRGVRSNELGEEEGRGHRVLRSSQVTGF